MNNPTKTKEQEEQIKLQMYNDCLKNALDCKQIALERDDWFHGFNYCLKKEATCIKIFYK